jgi:hypothetical protein
MPIFAAFSMISLGRESTPDAMYVSTAPFQILSVSFQWPLLVTNTSAGLRNLA